MLQIEFQQKPTDEQILHYEKRLEYFLQNLNAKVKIKLLESPLRMESYKNSEHTHTTYLWINGIYITTPEVNFKTTAIPFRQGIDSLLNDGEIWADAYYIQDQIYLKLKRQPVTPPNDNDPYWKLWKLR